MSNISEVFLKRKALITFITAGDPSLPITEKLIYDLKKAGADIIELGIPFSDPLADGPVIQESHLRALKKNVSLKDAFSLVRKIKKKSPVPLVFMLSDNLIEKYGKEKFYADCNKAGVDGVIVPDLPPEETDIKSKQQRVDRIFLISPTTSDERIKRIAAASSGFVYLVSATGITGKRAKLAETLPDLIARVKKFADKPVAVGFGISNPKQASEAVRYADGVIVGSAIVEMIAKKQFMKVRKFVSSLRRAVDAG